MKTDTSCRPNFRFLLTKIYLIFPLKHILNQ